MSSGSISSLSMASSVGDSAAEAKRREEHERIKIIYEWKLKDTATNHRKKDAVWKRSYYFTSDHKDHKKDVFCMECRQWITNGIHTHVMQHEARHHHGTATTTSDSSSSRMQQLKVNQTIKLPQEAQERLNAKLVDFLIRDAQPAALTQDDGFREFVHALNPRFVMPGIDKINAYILAMSDAAQEQESESKIEE